MFFKTVFYFLITVSCTLVVMGKPAQQETTIVCYFSWRGEETGLLPENIELGICTHIIVGFAGVVNGTVNFDQSLRNGVQRTAVLREKDPNLKVLYSIGGGGGDEGFADAVRTQERRKIFIDSILSVIRDEKLDGVDFDWEFPSWLRDWRERGYFAHLLKEFRYAADETGLDITVTVATTGVYAIMEVSYDMTAIAAYADYVNLMSYDYHVYDKWLNPFTGHNSPLFPRNIEKAYFRTLNTAFSAEQWVKQGVPRSKLLVGLPFYGIVMELLLPYMHGLDAPAAGEITDWDYPTILNFLRDGGIRVFDNESRVPYAYLNTTWVTYEDQESVTHKATWLKSKGFGGAMIFNLNSDDWNNTRPMGNETFPLLKTVSRILKTENDIC